MITYQDFLKVGESVQERMTFATMAIGRHKASDLYKTAVIADDYNAQKNTTITNYQKMLYTMAGQAVPDNFSANYKMCSNFFNLFVTQENQYLLGNGVTWSEESTAEKLGSNFDYQLQKLGHMALVEGVAFGFFNLDHIEVFSIKEFAPLYDEETGALRAGIRFWQIDDAKPLRLTIYEEDGYTDYIIKDGDSRELHAKRPYKIFVRRSEVDGEEIYDGENYPSFPIVPMWGNPSKQSELTGLRMEIDAYDLIKSGFANDLDDASQIYWIVQNAGGMDDVDLARFLDRLKTVKAAAIDDDGAHAEPHTIDVPYAAREALLTRLRADMFEDYMALDTKNIANGAVTATQIEAAYESMDNKSNLYKYEVTEFIRRILAVAGIEDEPTFTKSRIVNKQEEIQVLLQSATFLPMEYVTQRILNLLGDGDRAEEILKDLDKDERIAFGKEE